jgi:hypothetical protein
METGPDCTYDLTALSPDTDNSQDGDASDSDKAVDKLRYVTLPKREDDTDNDFLADATPLSGYPSKSPTVTPTGSCMKSPTGSATKAPVAPVPPRKSSGRVTEPGTMAVLPGPGQN